MKLTGVHIKRAQGKRPCHLPRIELHKPASLRDATKDFEGYYLKIDCGKDSEGSLVQVHVTLSRFDVERVVERWQAILEQENDEILPDR